MGVPQQRHRVFFVAVRNDLNIDPRELDMTFNYEPVTYGEIKSGTGQEINHNSKEYKMLSIARHGERSIANVYARLGEKERRFSAAICWEDDVLPTIVAKLFHYRGTEKTKISAEDIIHAQTFPTDYDFVDFRYDNIAYMCGMSVPPIMIKRIVTRLIEQGVYDYAKSVRTLQEKE